MAKKTGQRGGEPTMPKSDTIANKHMAKAEDKTQKKAEAKVTYLTTKDVAAIHKVKPAFLRRVLRSLPKFTDGTYTRYKFEEGDKFLADLASIIAKFKEKESKRNAERLANLKAGKGKKDDKAGKASKGKKEEPADNEEAEEIV